MALGVCAITPAPALAQALYTGRADPSATNPIPNNSTGPEGSWYLEQLSGNIYGPKTNGIWPNNPLTNIPTNTFPVQCHGVATYDDAPAINAATQLIRNIGLAIGGNSGFIGPVGQISFTGSNFCYLLTPVNWTSSANIANQPKTLLLGSGFTVYARGIMFICKTTDTICIDATGEGHGNFLGINLYGSCVNGSIPKIGIMFARPTTSLAVGAGYNHIDHLNVTGCFTFTAGYFRATEETKLDQGEFNNYQSGVPGTPTYATVLDGANHWAIQSIFNSAIYTTDTYSSFNNFQCDDCNSEVLGTNAIPMWVGGTNSLSLKRNYLYAPNVTSGPSQVIYTTAGIPNNDMDDDIHSEDKSLTCDVEFDSVNANPTLYGFRFHDQAPQQSGPAFCRGAGVTTISLQAGSEIRIGVLGGIAPSWWDSAPAFTMNGNISTHDSTFTLPGTYTGQVCTATSCITH